MFQNKVMIVDKSYVSEKGSVPVGSATTMAVLFYCTASSTPQVQLHLIQVFHKTRYLLTVTSPRCIQV